MKKTLLIPANRCVVTFAAACVWNYGKYKATSNCDTTKVIFA